MAINYDTMRVSEMDKLPKIIESFQAIQSRHFMIIYRWILLSLLLSLKLI